jgi:hypothetical protein
MRKMGYGQNRYLLLWPFDRMLQRLAQRRIFQKIQIEIFGLIKKTDCTRGIPIEKMNNFLF